MLPVFPESFIVSNFCFHWRKVAAMSSRDQHQISSVPLWTLSHQRRRDHMPGEEFVLFLSDLRLKKPWLPQSVTKQPKISVKVQKNKKVKCLKSLKWCDCYTVSKVKFFPHSAALPSSNVLQECQRMECVPVDANCRALPPSLSRSHTLSPSYPSPFFHPVILSFANCLAVFQHQTPPD